MSDITGVRSELIARFKREIKEKTYKVKSQEIADKITQKLKEDEGVTKTTLRKKWTA